MRDSARMRDTAWMSEGKWGVMCHYLAEGAPDGGDFGSYADGIWPSAQEWNARVDAYDVPGIVGQLRTAGAGWLLISVGQNSGYYCAPNAVLDELAPGTPEYPGKRSRRDLIKDLGSALHAAGIRLVVYLTGDAIGHDDHLLDRLGGRGAVNASDRYQANWLRAVECWSRQWGSLVDGYWVDGCYFPEFEGFYGKLADALRAGNPAALVAFNPGRGKLPHTGAGDYLAGEANPGHWPMPPQGRFLDHRGTRHQVHYLTDAQGYWGNPPDQPMAFTTDDLIRHTISVTETGGAVTWDVGYHRENGHLSQIAMRALTALGEATGTSARVLPAPAGGQQG
jgi:hypothetical protein